MERDIPMSIKMGSKSFREIRELDRGERIDETDLLEKLAFIDYRFDCADFRMVTILRTVYSYSDYLSRETLSKMRNTILQFKYWMDEPGDDSMCYWSENHQILFFTSAYLAGNYYPYDIFENSRLTGEALSQKFRAKILIWLEHRFENGFIEWHSNTYYEEDIAALTLLIDFADEEIIKKATIIMDLILADMAMHLYKGLLNVSSGRCYQKQKCEPLTQEVQGISEFLFGKRYMEELDYTRISANLYLCKNYKLPRVILEIANDIRPAVVKTSMGHELHELKKLRLEKGRETAGYIQWAMESFTNPESIRETMRMYRAYNMKTNGFLKELKMLDHKVLTPILPLISRILNPVTNGGSILKANTYTYRTENYILSTAQSHHPGTFGDQQHIWQATINEQLSVFATHPATPFFDDRARNFSPSYWVGNGIMPHSVQHENIVLSIFRTGRRKGFMEKQRLKFTHAYFPSDRFDDTCIEGRYAFGTCDGAHIALAGRYDLEVNPDDPYDIIQRGKTTFWICELSDSGEGFEDFMQRIKSKSVSFRANRLTYDNLTLRYKGEFLLDGKKQNIEYRRIESPYGIAERGAKVIEFNCNEYGLKLGFEQCIREEI